MTGAALARSQLPLPLVRRGKVREVYAVGDDQLLLVASDRISAFDVVMREPIPYKGAVLTQMSAYWFDLLKDISSSHFVTCDVTEIINRIPDLESYDSTLEGRSTLVTRTDPVPFECVIRGYLSGSAWAEYAEDGTLAGERLEPGMVASQQLDPPLFSPASKAYEGHDENITFGVMRDALEGDLAERLRRMSLELYAEGCRIAAERGIIIADTKFEFGIAPGGQVMLIDELLTPDSSRFWPADQYEPGRGQPSFDKQPLRDYLAESKSDGSWDGAAPPPTLSAEIVAQTSARYLDAHRRITGSELPIV